MDGLFVAVGHLPNTAIFKGKIDLHPNEYVNVTPGAAGDGVKAATPSWVSGPR